MMRTEQIKRTLMSRRIGADRSPVPPLVREHEALATAAVGLHEALADLLAHSSPSPWRAAGQLLRVLHGEPAGYDSWGGLRSEFEAAWESTDEGKDSILARLLMHLEDVLDELERLAPDDSAPDGSPTN